MEYVIGGTVLWLWVSIGFGTRAVFQAAKRYSAPDFLSQALNEGDGRVPALRARVARRSMDAAAIHARREGAQYCGGESPLAAAQWS